MDTGRKSWFRMAFKARFLECKWNAFQELFADIMERSRPDDFERIDSAGPKGDHGCDGYLRSTRTVFQVYAPRDIRGLKELHDKITSDFKKAKAFFKDRIVGWIFVHNRKALSAQTVKLIQDLGNDNPGISVDSWGFETLWKEVEKLPEEKLYELLPPGPSEQMLPPAQMSLVAAPSELSVDALHTAAAAGIEASPIVGSTARCRMLCEQVDAQAEAIRRQLDKVGQGLWDEIKRQMATLSFAKAIVAGKDLEKWLLAEGGKASATVRGRAYVLLADLAVIEASDTSTRQETGMTRAREYYENARDAFGAEISEEDSTRLISLAAKLDAVDGNFRKAFTRTEGIDNPGVTSLRLAILIEQQSWTEAAALLENKPLHDRWADSAVILYIEQGESDGAAKILAWAKDKDTTLHHRCLLSFARTVVVQRQEKLRQQGPIVPGQLAEEDREQLGRALSMLHPVLCGPESSDHVRTGIEVEGLAVAMSITYLVGRLEEYRRFWCLLSDHRPLHLAVPQGVLAGVVEAPEDLPERLRRDHPASAEFLTLAATIEGIHLRKPAEAVAAVENLIEQASSAEMKERWCELLGELAAPLDPETQRRIDATVRTHLGGEHRLVRLRRVVERLRVGNTTEAAELLDTLQDENDPAYWQLAARLRYMQDDKPGAADALLAAARLLTRVDVWRSAAGLAEESGRLDLLEEALQNVLAYAPEDDRARFRLGLLYVGQQHFANAAACFRILWDRTPDECAFGLNLATCLRNDGKAAEALAILEQVCRQGPPSCPALLNRAQILRELGKPDQAFQSLKPFRHEFWSDTDFLLAYVGLAYAAAHDDAAHEAFGQLLELKREGKVSPDKLWSASVEQAVELIKEHHETVHSADMAVLRGQLPWLVVEQVRGFPPYLGWRFRTRETNVSDSLDARATCAVYATNRFTVQEDGEAGSRLVQIRCPPPGSDVVVDITSLITLHRLGLLGHAHDYFGTINVPAAYIPTMADDAVNLAAHQPSVVQAWKSIDEELDAGHICILPDLTAAHRGELVTVAEYYDRKKEPPGYHLIDLFTLLRSTGRLSETQYEQAKAVAQKAPRSDLPPMKTRGPAELLTDRHTLRAVFSVGLLEVVLRATRVHITQEEASRIRSELKVAAAGDEVLRWHENLSEILRDQSRFKRLTTPQSPPHEESHEDARRDLPLMALKTAQDQNLALFVDDRACQAAALNARRTDASEAFGTDAFLYTLLRRDIISVSEAARHFGSLMTWRYRFLLPPSAVLLHWAQEYRAHPPGPRLIALAQYMQDCMRDPGLFCGPEPTKPPLHLAVHIWFAWMRILSEFLINLWLIPDVDVNLAQEITKWSVTECLPTPPANLPLFAQQNAAQALPKTLLREILFRAVSVEDQDAANRAILAVKESLELPDLEYVRLIGDVADDRF